MACPKSPALLFAFSVLACPGCFKREPPPQDPIIGAWGDDDHVFQFFSNGTCVLLGTNFNVAASYQKLDGKIRLTQARLQYELPSFVQLNGQTVELNMQHDYELRLSGGFLKETLHLTELTQAQADAKVGEISAAHRDAVRKAKAPLQKGQTASPR